MRKSLHLHPDCNNIQLPLHTEAPNLVNDTHETTKQVIRYSMPRSYHSLFIRLATDHLPILTLGKITKLKCKK